MFSYVAKEKKRFRVINNQLIFGLCDVTKRSDLLVLLCTTLLIIPYLDQRLLHFALLTEQSELTCSFVVRPLETRYRWKPVRPSTGMRNKPDTLTTTNLRRLSRLNLPQHGKA